MDVASEYRYRNPVVGPGDLVIGITQSGETADTLAAMRLARERGATVLAITNVMGSQATRDADGVLYTRAGLEIGVAATKTFVCQVAVMYLLALRLAELRGTLDAERARELVDELKRIPHEHRRAARERRPRRRSPSSTRGREFFLYLGRHVGLPVALEGALKLKEISYIPTDAYAAGEMKHGPIALLDESHAGRLRRHRLAGARQGRLQHRRRSAPAARTSSPSPREGNDRDRRARRGGHPRSRARTGCCSRCWP